jgi:5-methylcytosine-specific restriction endonuclease McrA
MQVFFLILVAIAIFVVKQFVFKHKRKLRRDYYRNEYLKSEEWQRKRHVIFKRDNWLCVYCGLKATQIHHKRYAKYNIGKEPIEWLVSVCKSCHDKQHS